MMSKISPITNQVKKHKALGASWKKGYIKPSLNSGFTRRDATPQVKIASNPMNKFINKLKLNFIPGFPKTKNSLI